MGAVGRGGEGGAHRLPGQRAGAQPLPAVRVRRGRYPRPAFEEGLRLRGRGADGPVAGGYGGLEKRARARER